MVATVRGCDLVNQQTIAGSTEHDSWEFSSGLPAVYSFGLFALSRCHQKLVCSAAVCGVEEDAREEGPAAVKLKDLAR